MTAQIEKVTTRLVRYIWTCPHDDGSASCGWSGTRRAARKAIAQAERDYQATKVTPLRRPT